MERPEALAAADVVSANITLGVFFGPRRRPGLQRRADDDDVVDDDSGRVELIVPSFGVG